MTLNWKSNRFACSSFTVCAVEMAIFLAAIILVRTPFDHPVLIKKATGIAWLFGTPAMILLAFGGVLKDDHRTAAVAALLVAIACGLFCTLQMLV